MSDDRLDVLARGLDQLAALLGDVSEQQLADPTPCAAWTVADLVDHVVSGVGGFATTVRGETFDWTAPTPHVGSDRADMFRTAAAQLMTAWRDRDGVGEPVMADWQSAELAVHTWDLATALGRAADDLDPAVAERGLAFMTANLTPENRGRAFGPEQPAPDGADAYQRIAAFAGREVAPSR